MQGRSVRKDYGMAEVSRPRWESRVGCLIAVLTVSLGGACSYGGPQGVTAHKGCAPPLVVSGHASSIPLASPKNPLVVAIPRSTVSESQINRFYFESLYPHFGGCITREATERGGETLEWRLYFLVGTKPSVIAAVETKLTRSELFQNIQHTSTRS